MTATKHFSVEDLRALDPCGEAMEWVNNQTGTPSELWEKCPRSDWMLWLLHRIRPLTQAESVTLAWRFALEVLPIFEARYPEDKRPRQAIEAAQAWAQKPTKAAAARAADASRAAYAAYAAYAAADAAYAAAEAAYAAARAADAAYAASHAVYAAADAAYAAARAAADAAYAAARAADAAARKKQADIIREIIGNPFS